MKNRRKPKTPQWPVYPEHEYGTTASPQQGRTTFGSKTDSLSRAPPIMEQSRSMQSFLGFLAEGQLSAGPATASLQSSLEGVIARVTGKYVTLCSRMRLGSEWIVGFWSGAQVFTAGALAPSTKSRRARKKHASRSSCLCMLLTSRFYSGRSSIGSSPLLQPQDLPLLRLEATCVSKCH